MSRGKLTGGTTMGIIAWIVLGLIAGAIAKYIMPGRDPGGIIVTIILGIVGAVVGGFISAAIFGRGVESLDIMSIIIAIIGAVIVLAIYHMVTSRRATGPRGLGSYPTPSTTRKAAGPRAGLPMPGRRVRAPCLRRVPPSWRHDSRTNLPSITLKRVMNHKRLPGATVTAKTR
jgi:uncharacterized membrane protein YeaQ/YmgE (transglycosylase-associated protein family)